VSRGEPAARGERGPGLAIFAAFGVVCLGALFLVVWSTRACDGYFAPAWPATAPEPFSGAEAALVPLGTRACLTEGGPAVGFAPAAATTASRVEAWLSDRGYVAADTGFGDPSPAPVEVTPPELAGSCGVVVFLADGGTTVSGYGTASGRLRLPCQNDVAIVPVCEGETARVEGSGVFRHRVFLMPGMTPRAVAESGMSTGVLLAHAEAEAHLRALGWEPADEVVRVDVPAGTSGSHAHAPPARPPSGCIGWVVASDDLGGASTQWAHRHVDTDGSAGQLVIGLVSCELDPAMPTTETTLLAYDDDGGGGSLYFRPYAPATGPVVAPAGVERRALGAGSMRARTTVPATLPAAVPMTAPTPH
jgi:hypothetical protein